MSAPYLDWPFDPDKRSGEQQERWWQACHVESAADRQLRGVYHWFLLAGPPGSGKSVAREAWERRAAAGALVLSYPPKHWPGSSDAWFPDNPSHLAQMLAVAGLAVSRRFQENKYERLAALDPFQRRSLRALLEFMGGEDGEAHFRRFLARAPRPLAEELMSVAVGVNPFQTRGWRGVQDQIEQLAELVAGLGFGRVVYVIDPPDPLGPVDEAGLADLFGWLDLADNPGFAVAAVVPQALLDAGPTLARARGRAGLVYTGWTAEECHAAAERHMRLAALDLAPGALATLLPPGGLADLDEMITAEWGALNPRAWVLLAETLLYLTRRAAERLPTPLDAGHLPRLKAAFFNRHVRLVLDPNRLEVWRGGPRPIALQNQPFQFLRKLQELGRLVHSSEDALIDIAGKQDNVYSLASRAREAIEPVKGEEAYLFTVRGYDGGYRLENCDALPLTRPTDSRAL